MKRPTPTSTERQVKEDAFLVSKTDSQGRITYCNLPFIDIVGATEQELLGKPHSIVRHPDMPRYIFKLLWDRIKNKEEIFAYVKNMSFDGSYYWVFANVTASFDRNNAIVGFYSVRRRANPNALQVIIPLYQELLAKEKNGGMEAAEAHMKQLLNAKGVSYDQFANALQRS